MARARNIKPGLFKNEDLAECSIWARYIFAGLWTLADREGRLEDRPKRIKGELLPFDSQDVEPLLRELAQNKFLERYEVDGERFIQITKFRKHQSPHYSEKASVIKPPPLPEKAPHIHPPNSRSSPVIKEGSQPPDSLIPDSPIPDSLEKDSGLRPVCSPSNGNGAHHFPACPVEEIIGLYHAELPMCPRITVRNSKRDKLISGRWRQVFTDGKAKAKPEGVELFREFFHFVRDSKFLTGKAQASSKDRSPFVADLEWLMSPTNFAKTVEGRYHR